MPIRQLDRAAIRREARELIRTARVSPIKFTLLFLAVSLALSLLDTALTRLTGRILGVANEDISFANLHIVEVFFAALWAMHFLIPGINAVYRYSFAIWNLCQNPELGVMEALNRSKRQTIGYKGQLFGLHLSFIGWYLIVFVIVGV